MQTKNHRWFDAGPFNQKPSIKTTPAQCPAAATGFIKLILGLCAMQELPSRQATPNQRWPNVGSPSTTLDQRHTKIDSTYRVRRAPHMKISRADPPAKLRPRPKAACFTAGIPVRTPAQQQNNIGTLPASPGQCRYQEAKTLSQSCPNSWSIVYDDDPTPRRHRPRASPSKHENVQPMSVQCCPIVFDAGPTLQQHRPHASRPPVYAYTGPTNAATR